MFSQLRFVVLSMTCCVAVACSGAVAGFFLASYVAGIQPPPSLLKKAASPKPRDYIYIERGIKPSPAPVYEGRMS